MKLQFKHGQIFLKGERIGIIHGLSVEITHHASEPSTREVSFTGTINTGLTAKQIMKAMQHKFKPHKGKKK